MGVWVLWGRGSGFWEETAVGGRFQKNSRKSTFAIFLVGAAHGVLSGQLAAGWLDGPVACFAKNEESLSKKDSGDRRC